jgi:hypothetical protein
MRMTRIAAALVAALVLFLGLRLVLDLRRRAMDVVIPAVCYSIPIDNVWLRWLAGCPTDTAGGGGSGAA